MLLIDVKEIVIPKPVKAMLATFMLPGVSLAFA